MRIAKPSRGAIVKAKKQIKALLQKEGTMDYVGILDRLDVDLVVMVMACEELEREGKIEGDASGTRPRRARPSRRAIVKAKKQMLDLLQKERTLDYIGILDRLDIELDVMVLACDELEKEGKVEEVK